MKKLAAFCLMILISVSVFALMPEMNYSSVLDNFDFSEGNFSAEDFLQLAFIASGSPVEERETLTEKVNCLREDFTKQIQEAEDFSTCNVADKALIFLHENVFKTYNLNQTLVSRTLNDGSYNCVSSAVLYMYFLKVMNIKFIPVEVPEHALCTVIIEDDGTEKLIDVETTNKYGFNPGIKREIAPGKFTVSAKKNYKNRQNVNEARFLSLIYMNQISQLGKKSEFFRAWELCVDAVKLENKSQASLNSLYGCASNLILVYEQKKQIQEGLQFVSSFIDQYGFPEEIKNNVSALVCNQVTRLSSAQKFTEAYDFLEQNKDLISTKEYADNIEAITVNSLNIVLKQKDFAVSKKMLEENKDKISSANYTKLNNIIFQDEAYRIAKATDYYEAAVFLSSSANLSQNKYLTKLKSEMLYNYEAGVHNDAVKQLRSGNRKAALELINEGLKKYPESKILKNDLLNF